MNTQPFVFNARCKKGKPHEIVIFHYDLEQAKDLLERTYKDLESVELVEEVERLAPFAMRGHKYTSTFQGMTMQHNSLAHITWVEVYIDYINKRIHILDMDKPNIRTVTNAMSEDYKAMLVDQMQAPKEVMDFTWLCYATDGIVSEYKDYNFKFINDKAIMFPPFQAVMVERSKALR